MPLVRVAGILYAVFAAVVVAFQLALAAGAPWGAYAMSGAFPGQLPRAARAGVVVQAALVAAMALVVLSRAGLILPGWLRATHWLIWVVVALQALTFVLNLITPSAGERAIWAPVAFVLLGCSVIVALSRP